MKNKSLELDHEMEAKIDEVFDKYQGVIPKEDLKLILDVSENGAIRSSRANCVRIFRHDPDLYGKFRYNILAQMSSLTVLSPGKEKIRVMPLPTATFVPCIFILRKPTASLRLR